MKLNISAVDLLSLRMTQAVAIAPDRISAFAGVPSRLVRANQPGSSACRASVAGSSAWTSVHQWNSPDVTTGAKAAPHRQGALAQYVPSNRRNRRTEATTDPNGDM